MKYSILAVAVSAIGLALVQQARGADKITICHSTMSDSNPYVTITVDSNSLAGHLNEDGSPHCNHGNTRCDIIPAPATGCPGNEPPVEPPIEPPCTDCDPPTKPPTLPPPTDKNVHSVPVLINPVEWLLNKFEVL